jgi:CRP-like cAMP-binding protein
VVYGRSALYYALRVPSLLRRFHCRPFQAGSDHGLSEMSCGHCCSSVFILRQLPPSLPPSFPAYLPPSSSPCPSLPFFPLSRQSAHIWNLIFPALLCPQIRKGEYTFPSPYWDEVSQGAKDIVSKMLVVDPTKRYTAQQCLDHPWIRNAGEASAKKMHSSHRAFLLIRKLPIFDNIDPTCLQEVTVRLKVVRVEQGKFICRAGQPGDCMFFINSGTVQILVNGNEVDRLTTGDFFGEISLTVSSQRTADVKSLGATSCHGPRGNRPAEAVELFQLDRSDFDAVQDKYPVLKSRLAQIGESRVKRASAPVSQEAGSGRNESPPRQSAAAKENNGRDSQDSQVASPRAPAAKSKAGSAGGGAGGGGGASAAAASSPARGGGNSAPASPAPARKPEAPKESSGCQCVCS